MQEHKKNIGVYPGSFDPLTSGHMDVLRRAAALMDHIIVGVLVNSTKKPYFSVEERIEFIEAAIKDEGLKNVSSASFDGLLVDYLHTVDARHIIRGLRAMTDFEYEMQLDAMNRMLAPDIDTIYFMAEPKYSFLSSSVVKEIGALGASIDKLVPTVNQRIITERLLNK